VFQAAVNNNGANTLSLLALNGGVASEGGFPIVIDGKLVGAIGASGGIFTRMPLPPKPVWKPLKQSSADPACPPEPWALRRRLRFRLTKGIATHAHKTGDAGDPRRLRLARGKCG